MRLWRNGLLHNGQFELITKDNCVYIQFNLAELMKKLEKINRIHTILKNCCQPTGRYTQ